MKQRMQKMESFAYAVTITRKRGLRAIYLRISRTGKVLVSAPSAMALGEVEHFVASRMDGSGKSWPVCLPSPAIPMTAAKNISFWAGNTPLFMAAAP